jgi:hypothetical protein
VNNPLDKTMKKPALLLLLGLLYVLSTSALLAAPPDRSKAIQQRLSLSESYLNSNSAYNIADGDNQAAKQFLQKARDFLQKAQDALKAGNLDLAAENADQSLRAYSAAGKAAKGGAQSKDQKTQENKALRTEIDTYHQAFMAALREKGPSMSGLLDQRQVDELLQSASRAEKSGDSQAANNDLNRVKVMVVNALTKIRSNETVVYGLEFQTPADEYRYEGDRFGEYLNLTNKMIAQTQIDGPKLHMIKTLQAKGEALRDEAVSMAAKGDFESAITQMEAALKKLVQGLQVMGLPVSL